jgi:hypothetical protein
MPVPKKKGPTPPEVERAKQAAEAEVRYAFSSEALKWLRGRALHWNPEFQSNWATYYEPHDRAFYLLQEMQMGIEMRYLWPFTPEFRDRPPHLSATADWSAERAEKLGIPWAELIAREARSRKGASWSLLASLAPPVGKVRRIPAVTAGYWEPTLRDRQRDKVKKAKADAQKARRAKAYEAAVVYARERLRPLVEDGWFDRDHQQITPEELELADLHAKASRWHSEYVEKVFRPKDTKPTEEREIHEFLSGVFTASSRLQEEVDEARDYVAALPECPAGVKDYVVNHLLPNFRDPSQLRGFRRGAGTPAKSDRNALVAETVEIICLRFDLDPTKNPAATAKAGCQCVAEALNDLDVDIKYSGVVEVHRMSLAPILVRTIAGRFQKLLGVPLHEAPFLLGPPLEDVAKAVAETNAELQGETI